MKARVFRPLIQITLKNLSTLVDTAETVDSLELPTDLSKQLKDEIVSCWKHRYLTDLRNLGKTSKSFSEDFNEDFNDKRHEWRARIFDEKHRFNIEFQ